MSTDTALARYLTKTLEEPLDRRDGALWNRFEQGDNLPHLVKYSG